MTDAPLTRLEQLEELLVALRPAVLASHSEHGLQGLSGLVGQYRAALKEVEDLRAMTADVKGTPLDELAKRRSGRGSDAPRSARASN